MISRITPDALAKFSWNGYLKELKQDFLHMRTGDPLQFFFVLEYEFPKGGKGPLFVIGSNLKAYWQQDEMKQLESDFWRTHLHGIVFLLEDKKTLELDIKKGGIIKSNKQVIEIAFRKIFRPLGYGNMRVTFKGHTKKHGSSDNEPQSLVEKIDYLKTKPDEIQLLLDEARERHNFPEKKVNAYLTELKLAQSRNNIHKMVEWYFKIETLLIDTLEDQE